MSEVVIAGGGTGGHLFPGLAVAAELRRREVAVSWLGAARGLEASRVPPAGLPLRLLPVTGAVGRGRAAQAGALLRLLPATAIAVGWLLSRHAVAVLSVGGYAAMPGALAACALGLPLLIQEQNARPGLTNRLLGPWATAIACGFEAALAAFPSLPARWTGNPVRAEFFAVPPPPPGPPALLVIGGSQGAAALNRAVPEALALAARSGLAPRIVHQAGPRWEAEVRERYAHLGLAAETVAFLERPWEALANATIVIARAGALSVCEIAASARFALLVPFAAAAHGHQDVNAAALAATGAAEIVTEAEATAATLARRLERLLADAGELARRGRAGRSLARPTAAGEIASLLQQQGGITAPRPGHGGGA